MSELVKLDDLDLHILQMLKRNAQESLNSLAKAIGDSGNRVPRSTIHSRIKRLEDKGIISKYTLDLNYRQLGFSIIAFVMVNFDQYNTDLDQEEVASLISRLPFVEEVHVIAGDWDILLKIHAKDIDNLGDISVKHLKSIPGVGKTLTYVSLKRVKEHSDGPFIVD